MIIHIIKYFYFVSKEIVLDKLPRLIYILFKFSICLDKSKLLFKYTVSFE